MLDNDLLDLVYDLLSKKLNEENKSISYDEIINSLKSNFSEKEVNQLLGSLYIDMLQDTRFIFLGKNNWTLSKLNNLEFIKNNQSALYNYDNNSSVKESYDEESLPQSMIDEENEVFEENEFEISRDSLEIQNDVGDDINLDNNLSNDDEKYEFDE